MKKVFLLTIASTIISASTYAQTSKSNSKDTSVGSEYIPVEGRSTGVPKQLQGTWVLSSGLKRSAPPIGINTKKPAPGSEIRRDSVTTTSTINGQTHTTTEVEIEKMAPVENQVTPPQKGKMHVAEKPSISFYGLNETFSGFTGCNKYSGRYKITGNKILLLNGAASTKMVCMGEYDEKEFLNTLARVNAYRTTDGRLELLDGNDVLLAFSRK